MRLKTVFIVVLLSVLPAVQATAPSKHHHSPAKDHAAVNERWRGSNAYAIPDYTSDLSEGAMTSGIAGH
jgi:hypothetical protein